MHSNLKSIFRKLLKFGMFFILNIIKSKKKREGMISVFEVADFFLTRERPDWNWRITHLKLQKLVFYAQAWTLAKNGKTLFDDEFEAWVHGPVCWRLYYTFKVYGFNEIPIQNKTISLDPNIYRILTDVWDRFGDKSAKYLEELVRSENPWIEARENDRTRKKVNVVIERDSILNYYRELLKDEI